MYFGCQSLSSVLVPGTSVILLWGHSVIVQDTLSLLSWSWDSGTFIQGGICRHVTPHVTFVLGSNHPEHALSCGCDKRETQSGCCLDQQY